MIKKWKKMIVPDKLVVKQQNFSIICKGNDIKYHSNQYEYDYIKNALDFATKILKQQMNKKIDFIEHGCCFRLKKGYYFVMYINYKNKNNPYFAVYNMDSKTYSTKENVELFQIFKHSEYLQGLQERIENTLFQNELLLPGLLENMSMIADKYDNEIELDN